MTIDDVWQQICEQPDDDAPRLRYAELVEPSDPEWARFIRLQIERAHERRRGVPFVEYGEPTSAQAARWAGNLAMFTQGGNPDGVEFFRGFPAQIAMQAEVFAEHADMIFRLAPIRHIDFRTPCDEDWEPLRDDFGMFVPFPLEVVLACPQLARLDSLGFRNMRFEGDAGAQLAACPYLTRCQYIDFGQTAVTRDDILALAEGPLTGKMAGLSSGTARDDFGEHDVYERHLEGGLAYDYRVCVFHERGKALEARLGYIPWLHGYNAPSRIDIRWYVDQGRVPKFPPGSKPPREEWYALPPPYRYPRTW